MEEIKSARDIAQTRIDRVGDVTEADKLRWRYAPEGEKLAGKYFQEGHDLAVELKRFPVEALPYITKGLESVLAAAIILPKNDTTPARNQRAMDGLLVLKKDKAAAGKIIGQMRQILEHYADQGAKQRQATRDALKDQYEARVSQAMDKQMGGSTGMKINVESLPQFQEEWQRVSVQMDQQYLKLLSEFKRELAKIS